MLLEGVRVLDLSRLLPGAYCTQLLQRQGAHVIKVEGPLGDPIRRLPGGEAYFAALHEGKQLMRLDFRTAPGREALLEQVARVDVLVEGFRPRVLERLELGYDSLASLNRRLIFCSITGYGSSGRLAARAGHDLNYLALSGVLSLMPRMDGRPTIPGVQVADLAGGMEAAFLISAALARRARNGQGARVEVSMARLMWSWTAVARAARSAGPGGLELTGEMPCYRVYTVADGFLTVAALEADFWAAFCEVLERADLVARQFDPSAAAAVAEILKTGSRAHWQQRFGDRDVCVEPVLSLDESVLIDFLDGSQRRLIGGEDDGGTNSLGR